MKQLMITLCLIVLLQSSTMAQETWKDREYKPEVYRKVMVMAKVHEVTARRLLEDNTVNFLKEKGVVAIPAYSNPMVKDGLTREQFLVIADSMQVDALLVYSVNGAEKIIDNSGPTVSVGVGVGMYGGYASASVPISGGAKTVTQVKLSVYFYNRASLDEQWAMQLSGMLDDGIDKLAYSFARTTVKALNKDGMFLKLK